MPECLVTNAIIIRIRISITLRERGIALGIAMGIAMVLLWVLLWYCYGIAMGTIAWWRPRQSVAAAVAAA